MKLKTNRFGQLSRKTKNVPSSLWFASYLQLITKLHLQALDQGKLARLTSGALAHSLCRLRNSFVDCAEDSEEWLEYIQLQREHSICCGSRLLSHLGTYKKRHFTRMMMSQYVQRMLVRRSVKMQKRVSAVFKMARQSQHHHCAEVQCRAHNMHCWRVSHMPLHCHAHSQQSQEDQGAW